MEPILVIMAAGMGSRYGGNKQLDTITAEGDIIMDFSLFDAYEAGFRRVCFIIKHDFEDVFKAHIEKGAGKKYEVHYAFQELADLPEGYEVPEGRTKPFGTGQAVLAARDIIDAPFAVINADDYYGKEGFVKIYDFLTTKADASHNCMVGFEYMEVLKAGFVKALAKIMQDNPLKGEYYIQSPNNDQIADGSATYEVLTSSDKWFGVTYKEDKPDVVAKFAELKSNGTYPQNLWD